MGICCLGSMYLVHYYVQTRYLCMTYNIFFCDTALDPPISVQLVDVHDRQVVLQWTPVDSTCVPVSYSVTSNCSSCSPTATSLTTTSCPITQPTTDVLVCTFSVESVICDNLVGRSSSPAVVALLGKHEDL